jgi:rubrerythrin
MDAAQGAVDLLQQFFDALGGGKTVLLGISSLLMQIFSKNMAQEINNAVTNRAVQQQKLENLQNSQAALTTLGAANPNPNDANSQNILNFAQYMQANAKNFNAEQMEQANSILQELVQNSNAATMAADKLKDSLSVIGTGITATTGESILAPFLDSEGAVNATLLSEALQNMSQSEVADMFSHIQEDIKPAREGLLEFNKALQDYQQELRKTDSTDDSWNQSLANLKATLDNLQGKIDPSTYERYEQAVNEIAEVTDKAGDKTAETTAEVAKLADGLEKVAAKDLTNLDQLNKDAFQAKNTQMAAEDSNKVAGAFQEGMDSQAQIQGILNTVNAVQQLTFA